MAGAAKSKSAAIVAATLCMLGIPFATRASSTDARALNWYRCNTHTHTSAKPGSDANETPDFAANWYRSHGYQCLVITDHEFLTDVAPLNSKYGGDGKFLVLPGQEITQAVADPAHPNGLRYVHVNGLNINKAIMPVGHPAPAASNTSPLQAYERNIAAILAAGGIPQINHPNLQWSVRLGDLLPIETPFLFEVWNAFPTSNNLGGVDEAGNNSPSAEALWDSLLSKGRVVWAVAADDTHEYHKLDNRETPTPGKAWIVIHAPSLTASSVTGALREGRFYASTGISLESYSEDGAEISMRIAQTPDWNPALKPSARFVTRFIGANGRVLEEVTGPSPRYRFKGDEQYVRASITDSDGRRAWTQPVFLESRKPAHGS